MPIEPTVVAALRARLQARALSSADALEIMRESYRGYVRLNTHSFRELFAHLVDGEGPLVIHCTAGMHRSVMVAYAVLRLRGHDRAQAADLVLHYRPQAELVPAYVRSVERWLPTATS